MKTIRELRTTLRFHPHEINSSISFFSRQVSIDFDVYLPSKGINLQREFVWDIEQKRELIWSVLMNRHIPRMAMVCNYKMVYEVIDGKQRLSAMLGFYEGKFDLEIDGKNYFYDELPDDYRNVIAGFMFPYYIVHEEREGTITDQDKIDWFKYINFAGTPQDKEHMNKLEIQTL
jgi:uncharacterized protein with ParB-like and HNH nuclease domain